MLSFLSLVFPLRINSILVQNIHDYGSLGIYVKVRENLQEELQELQWLSAVLDGWLNNFNPSFTNPPLRSIEQFHRG